MLRSALGFLVVLSVMGCEEDKPIPHHAPKKQVATAPAGVEVDSAKVGLFAVLPAVAESKANPATKEKVDLGDLLFHDARLSKNQDTSCNTCHNLATFGADGKDFSSGFKGAPLERNTPSIYNSAVSFTQFWDGRAETVEDAVTTILADPHIMGAPGDARIVDTLHSMPAYVDAFKRAFPDDEGDPVTPANVSRALGAFVRTQMTPSKWDRFVGGDKTALTDAEKKGFLAFVDTGCPTCHVGALVGATMFQKLGKEKPWPNQKDKGRSAVTHSPSDDMMFKVSSLRNVEHTAPYFHDASAKTLEEAVKTMASDQLAKNLTDADVTSIVSWLDTLSGEPTAAQKAPELPASTAKTPKPSAK